MLILVPILFIYIHIYTLLIKLSVLSIHYINIFKLYLGNVLKQLKQLNRTLT